MVYVLKDVVTKEIITICDNEDNANQLKDNYLLIKQYRAIDIEEYDVDTDNILPLAAVKINGSYSVGGTKLSLEADNSSSAVEDNVEFTMLDKSVTFTGTVNLLQTEIDAFDLDEVKDRLKAFVKEQFKAKVEA